MNILVISKISIPSKDRTLPAWEHLRALGHTVVVEHPDIVPSNNKPDAMIVMGVTIMGEAFDALQRFPGVPLYCYQWDTYSWIWKVPGETQQYHPMRGQEYDYVRWGQLLRQAREVWVPSGCTARQAKKWWGIDHCRVILSSCPWWDPREGVHIGDHGYALCCLRHLPDKRDTWFEDCCADLDIPCIRDDHALARPDYERTVSHCRFLVSHYDEASTGGLSMMEGYRLGKPVLMSDSPWHAGWEYFGPRAMYFDHRSEVDFQAKLLHMHNDPPNPDPEDARKFIESNYNDVRMVESMLKRMEATR